MWGVSPPVAGAFDHDLVARCSSRCVPRPYEGSGHCGPDGVMSAVVRASDTLQALHVDGVGRADGRLQFGAAGNALGHGSHLRRSGSLPELW